MPLRQIEVRVDSRKTFQRIDGFGVNLNSKYWEGGALAPVLETLVDDLGCTLFRQDAWGKSDWPDPAGTLGKAALAPAHLARVYEDPVFANARAVAGWLNGRGLEPYLTLSGVVPRWMCAADGKTLKDRAAFAAMAASYAEWARKQAGVRFTLFGPLNETDIGPPEGPAVGPRDYVTTCEALVAALDARGLRDVKLVVPEQANYRLPYVDHILKSKKLVGRIGAFGIHTYGDGDAGAVVAQVRKSPSRGVPVWMTEFGDLDESGEREWPVAWNSVVRLLDLLGAGLNAALFWDAFDNYHDHDESWSIYGLIRRGIRMWTPKKRYHAVRHVFRFVRPGAVRVAADAGHPDLLVRAFRSADGRDLTVVGMNRSESALSLNLAVDGMEKPFTARRADVYRTTEELSCALVATVPVTSSNWPYTGIEVIALPRSIFTTTTIRP